jgi:DNA modification methylase
MYQILVGDVIERLQELEDESVDAVVTDPPYHLTSGKEGGTGEASVNLETPYGRARVTTGFMGMKWDGGDVAHNVNMWREVLRVLKPGGHLLSFGGSRTYHRMACAIEDAGFEIRDQIMWIYGSGFPKSLDVGKAIDKVGGKVNSWFGPWLRQERERIGMSTTELAERGGFYKNINHGGLVVNWEMGYGIPTAKQFNKVCEIMNLPFERLEEVKREVIGQRKVRKGLAFTSEGKEYLEITTPATDVAKQWNGWGTALKPSHEPIVVARKPLIGSVVENVLQYGTGALNIDACRIEYESTPNAATNPLYRIKNGYAIRVGSDQGTASFSIKSNGGEITAHALGRWPANVIHDGSDEVLGAFPNTPGQCADIKYNANEQKTKSVYGAMKRGYSPRKPENCSTNFQMQPGERRFDSGSAARFFYCAKVDRSERNIGCEDLEQKPLLWSSGTQSPGTFQAEGTDRSAKNNHPTVKPIDLMAYLCRLVTPPGGIILDCFMGSGSTGIAALRGGFSFIGIELNPDYVEIARRRIKGDSPLFNREMEGGSDGKLGWSSGNKGSEDGARVGTDSSANRTFGQEGNCANADHDLGCPPDIAECL